MKVCGMMTLTKYGKIGKLLPLHTLDKVPLAPAHHACMHAWMVQLYINFLLHQFK